MDERKERILHAIIQDYIKSAEPVGSRTIARNYNLGISPATVRNEMYDLEQLGFLEQPHTSAGRIPSAKGYRFYVDSLLNVDTLNVEDVERINLLWQQQQSSFDEFFLNAAKLVSQISHSMSLFVAPAHDASILKFIHVLPLDTHKAVMVVITDSGALDNEPIYFKTPILADELASLAMRFSNVLVNRRMVDLDFMKVTAIIAQLDGPREIYIILAEALHRAISKRKLFYSVGTSELLGQPEFKNVEKVQPILSLLEEQDQLNKIISQRFDNNLIKIKIGEENEVDSMQDMSLIQADFSTPDEHFGTLAILGPTRMEYSRVMGILTYINQFLEAVAKNQHKK